MSLTTDVKNSMSVFETHISNIKHQCKVIEQDICTSVKVDDINNVTPSNIKTCAKFYKENLADYLLSLLNLSKSVYMCDYVCKYFNEPNVSIDIESNVDPLLANCHDVTAAIEKSLKEHSVGIEQTISGLTDMINNYINNSPPSPSAPQSDREPNLDVPSSRFKINNPTKCHEIYDKNFVGEELSQKLTESLDNCDATNFNAENGHMVISFGEPYHYTGSKTNMEKTDIPEPFLTLISTIKTKYPDSNINSVLINKYSGPGSSISAHSDDELSIEPGSNIFCVSLGSSCKLTFKELHGEKREDLVVNHNSLYGMSLASQGFWCHSVDADSTSHFRETDVRYSITLRSVHPRFNNSTVIVGDSNTKHIKFGEGLGSFGYYFPGKRIEAPLIDDIDVTKCFGYSNIILHCGINNIKSASVNSITKVSECFEKLQHKVELIRKLCPKSRIIVSPILPTRDQQLSAKAIDFNEMLFCFEDNVRYFKTLNFNIFCNINGILYDSMGCQNPRDMLHLGSQGIKQLVKLFKDCIKGRKVRQGISYASITKGATLSPNDTNINRIVS